MTTPTPWNQPAVSPFNLFELGRYEPSRQLAEDALTRCRRVLGDEHPHTLRSAFSLLVSLSQSGRYEGARELGEDTVARMRRVLGEEHPETLRSAHSLAAALANRESARSDPSDRSVNQVPVSEMDHINSDRNPSRGADEAADAT